MAHFSGDLGLKEEDIPLLQQEIAFITENCMVEALCLSTLTGYQIVFAALPTFQIDSDALSGLSGAMVMTAKTTMSQVFREGLTETIIRAGNGYCIIANAGRFVLVGAGHDVKEMMKTSKTFRVAAKRIEEKWPEVD
jgi:predicted regulator of Ras-like GTPase activity (Roadblock/LC7/MglB family)